LKLSDVDFIISVLHPRILQKEILDKARIAAVNLHQAPLPEYKGCNSGSHAIMNGDTYFGATLHVMTEDVDDGEIIERRTFAIDDKITAKELYALTNTCCLEIFKDRIGDIINNCFETYPQGIRRTKTYFRDSLQKREADFNWPSKRLWNFVRALDFPPFEGAYIQCGVNRIYLRTRRK